MTKSPMVAAILFCALVGAASAAGVSDIPWNQSNVHILRGCDKGAVDTLVNDLRGGDLLHATVGGFGWYDLAGDKRYELVATEDLSGRAYFDYLAIYQQNSSGKPVLEQWIEGDQIGRDLDKVVRDLKNDGEQELVIPMELPPGNWSPAAMTPVWPAISTGGKTESLSRQARNFQYSMTRKFCHDSTNKSVKARLRASRGPTVNMASRCWC